MMQIRPILKDPAPPQEEGLTPEEYKRQLREWSAQWNREELAFNAALVRVLRFASSQVVGQPAWWLCGPQGQELVNALDTVLDALSPDQVRLFDQGTAPCES